MYTLYCWNWIR